MTRILIADDDLSMRVLLAALLAADGRELIEAEDGDQAWALLRRERPDVALLDVQMPGRTGVELTRQIRQDPDLAAMVVVLVSAKTQDTDVAAGLAAGADEYVAKPFSPARLGRLIQELLDRSAGRLPA